MIRSIICILLWILTLCAASFHFKFADGLEIELTGWYK